MRNPILKAAFGLATVLLAAAALAAAQAQAKAGLDCSPAANWLNGFNAFAAAARTSLANESDIAAVWKTLTGGLRLQPGAAGYHGCIDRVGAEAAIKQFVAAPKLEAEKLSRTLAALKTVATKLKTETSVKAAKQVALNGQVSRLTGAAECRSMYYCWDCCAFYDMPVNDPYLYYYDCCTQMHMMELYWIADVYEITVFEAAYMVCFQIPPGEHTAHSI